MSIIIKILGDLLCQYHNINVNIHQYLKGGKKKHKPITEKKKNLGTATTLPVE